MIEKRPFGRTGHMSTATIFGGAALIRATQKDAERTLEILLKYGVNHIDTAPRFSKRPPDEEMNEMMKKNKVSSLFGIGT